MWLDNSVAWTSGAASHRYNDLLSTIEAGRAGAHPKLRVSTPDNKFLPLATKLRRQIAACHTHVIALCAQREWQPQRVM